MTEYLSELEITHCATCGVKFAAPRAFFAGRREKGDRFYCPNGHGLSFTQTKAQELDEMRRERDLLKQRLAQKDDDIAKVRAVAAGLKKQVTILETRTAAGVCPCCNRSFTNLRRHMATKHKDFGAHAQRH